MEVIVSKRLFVPDNRIDELKRDVKAIMDPSSLAFNDGWAAKSFIGKWGFSVNDAQKLTGKYVLTRGFRKPR